MALMLYSLAWISWPLSHLPSTFRLPRRDWSHLLFERLLDRLDLGLVLAGGMGGEELGRALVDQFLIRAGQQKILGGQQLLDRLGLDVLGLFSSRSTGCRRGR